MGRKVIKTLAVLLGLAVLLSLFYYVSEQKQKPKVSVDELLKDGLHELNDTKNYPAAIAILREAADVAPEYGDVHAALGRAYLLSGNTDSAYIYFRTAESAEAFNETALRYLANISLEKKDTVNSIAYLTKYLKYYRNDQSIWLKKYLLLLESRQYAEAEKLYRSFSSDFSVDTIRGISANYWLTNAHNHRRNGNMSAAYIGYRKVLSYKNNEQEALEQLVNLALYLGRYEEAGKYNSILLRNDSTDSKYLVHASLIADKLGDRVRADQYAERAIRLHPTDTLARQHIAVLALSRAKDASEEDKLQYAKQLLQIDPSQKEGWLYLINSQVVSRQYAQALTNTNKALQVFPNDQTLVDKKIGILNETAQYAQAAEYAEQLLARDRSQHLIGNYRETILLWSNELIRQQQWQTAINTLQKGLYYQPDNIDLLDKLVTVYTSSGNTSSAMQTNERLLLIAPENETYQFRKAGLLEKQGEFEHAAFVTQLLTVRNPGNTAYRQAYTDQLTAAQGKAARDTQWNKVLDLFYRMPANDRNRLSWQYAIAAYGGKTEPANVLALSDSALAVFPNDSLFLVKKTLAHQSLGDHVKGLSISKQLLQKYPSDTLLQAMYLDQLYVAGKYYERENRNDTAIRIFLTAFDYQPKDTFALQNLSAIYFVKKQYDSSIYYADLGLKVDSTNEYLWMKKASSHEQRREYRSAYAAATKALAAHPSSSVSEYAAYLQSKTFMNQLGVSYLHSFFSSPSQYASVTGIQYTRRFNRGSISGRLNVGNRSLGTGVQGGLDLYYTHSTKYYSNLFVNISSGSAFPYWQAGYSLFRTLPKDWEIELGARYIGFDSAHIYTAVGSVGKYFNRTWVNARGFYSTDNQQWYPSGLLTVRQYLNDKNDYLSIIAGTGRIPDDPALVYNINNFRGYTSNTIGIGFQKTFRYKTTLNASASYTNLRLPGKQSLQQYDVAITLLRNF